MDNNLKPLISIDASELAKKGEEIYQKELKNKLEKDNYGKFVAIEVESKDYFLGETSIEASSKARKKHPDKIFYLVKIGFPAVFTMSNHFKTTSYGSIF